jgi:hypothetical protein
MSFGPTSRRANSKGSGFASLLWNAYPRVAIPCVAAAVISIVSLLALV